MIDIVIVNWNSGKYLANCVQSIFTSINQNLLGSIFVIDNNSSDHSIDQVLFHQKIKLVKNESNFGFAKACNQGFKLCSSNYILLLNPDAELLEGSLSKCLSFMDEHPEIDVCGCQLLNDHNEISKSCARFPTPARIFYDATGLSKLSPKIFTPSTLMTDWDHKSSRFVNQVMGAFMFMRKDVFEKAGYFDERFFVYFEELDFSKTLMENGGKIYFNASIQAKHAGEGTTRSVKSYRLFLFLRSRILYAKKHFKAGGIILSKISTFAIEPFSRILLSLSKGKWGDIKEVWHAYYYLIKNKNTQ